MTSFGVPTRLKPVHECGGPVVLDWVAHDLWVL